MTIRIHTTIAVTCVAATIAVGIASAAKQDAMSVIAPKADLLPVAARSATSADYVTVEQRGDGISVLARTPVEAAEPSQVSDVLDDLPAEVPLTDCLPKPIMPSYS